MKQAFKTAKGALNLSVGLGLGAGFAMTMDDIIYANLKKNVIMPLQMAQIQGDGRVNVSDLKDVGSGVGSFVAQMRPRAIIPQSAKELMLKDADYSTPQDHYFAHLQNKKAMSNDPVALKQLEQDVFAGMELDEEKINGYYNTRTLPLD